MLQLDGIECRYGGISALHGVSMAVGEREFVCLIGANGAGKSTLLRAISGLNPPVAGTISFEGERIDRALPATIVRLGIAQCPEERKLWPQISVEEHLEIGAFSRRDKAAIAEDIERVYGIFPRLKERRRQDAGTLSGGEQQMVAIGRALMSRPRLLMMDEPSLGLAPMIVESMAEVIKDIHAKGTSILLVEQNAMVALRMADRAYVLEAGNIVREGPSKDLLADDYVKQAYLGGSVKRRKGGANGS
jgi:branched-chain amino acid transport system ATP-binding protein